MKKTFLAGIICVAALTACNNDKTNSTTVTDTTAGSQVSDAAKAAAAATSADTVTTTNTMNPDNEFAGEAADGGMLEVKLGQLAKANGTAASVKALGSMMAMDHGKANDELKALAQKNNISLPAALSEKSQKTYDGLAAKKGADFDKAYAAMMVDDHNEDIPKFQSEADNGQNADLKAFAAKTLPTLKHHLEMSNSTKAGLK